MVVELTSKDSSGIQAAITVEEMDWKLKLMQVLDTVGNAEGILYNPWEGVSKEEEKEINNAYEEYSKMKEK